MKIALLDTKFMSEWISVNDRLPTQGPRYHGRIICIGYGRYPYCDECIVCEVRYDEKDSRFDTGDDEDIFFVTHWMPLPEPPNEYT